MLHGNYATHVLWVICDAEFDGDVHSFKFDLKKGHFQVKLGQIKSNFQTQSFLTKHAYLVWFPFRIPKTLFIFT